MEWIIPANHAKYNHVKAFSELPYVDWKQNANYSVGDRIYIYSTVPICAIEFLVEVINVDIVGESTRDNKEYWIDMEQYESGKKKGKYVRFKLIEHFKEDLITIKELHGNGLQGSIQSPRKLYNQDGTIRLWGEYIHKRLDNSFRKNNDLDNELKESIIDTVIDIKKDYYYSDEIMDKPIKIEQKGKKVYKRNKNIAINALGIANFSCEIDKDHYTFLRKKDGIRYTEPHHLIPMAFQDKFDKTIDIEENIISLCSNCHNEIHYGINAKDLITKLYYERRDLLAKKKIIICLDELLSCYGL